MKFIFENLREIKIQPNRFISKFIHFIGFTNSLLELSILKVLVKQGLTAILLAIYKI